MEISAERPDAAWALSVEAKIAITQRTEAQLEQGITPRRQERLQESIEHLRDKQKDPSDTLALHQLAISQRMAGDTNACDASLNALLAIQPKHPGALLEKILNAEQKAHQQQTLKRAESTPPLDSTGITPSIGYAITLRNAGLLEDSTKHLESLFAKHHNHTDICLELSRNRIMQGRYSAGRALVEKVLRATPNNRSAILLRIEYAALSGRLMHAIQFAQDAARLADNDSTVAIKLARLYRTVGWPQRAIDTLDNLAEKANDSTEAILIRADACVDMALFEQALSLYRRVLSEHPQSANALLKSIDLSLNGYGEKTPKNILDDLLYHLATSTKTTPSLQLLLAATARTGDWKGLLERCQSSQPVPIGRLSFYLYYTALGQFGLGDLISAKRTICRFLEFSPQDFPGKMLLADIEVSLGNREASLTLRQEVASTATLHQQSALMLQALDLARLGKPAEADKLLMSLKNLNGYFPTTNYLDELFMQGRTGEVADLQAKLDTLRDCPAAPNNPHSQPAADTPIKAALHPSRLQRLFDFERGDGLLGNTINPAAFLAWRLTDGKYGDYQAWSRRAVQATLASPILYRTPARDEDLEPFIASTELGQLETLLTEGRGFILASTHMGPAVCNYITLRIPNITYFQNLTTSSSTEVVGTTGLATVGKSQEAAIRAISTLRRGGVLSATPDVDIRRLLRGKAPPTAKTTTCLFGVHLEISNMVPKLSRELKVPSYWFQPQWQDGKIHFCIEPLPMAERNEDPDSWESRWAQAYLNKLEGLMTSAPENQNLNAPFWRYLLYYAHESAVLAPLLK